MPGAPYADPSDVESIWRPMTPAESELASNWIDVASQQIRDEVPLVAGLTVDQRIASDVLDQATVRDVVRLMVRRVMLNPSAVRTHSETKGAFSVSETVDDGVSRGELYISASEMARLRSSRWSSSQKAFMITPGPGPVFCRPGFW